MFSTEHCRFQQGFMRYVGQSVLNTRTQGSISQGKNLTFFTWALQASNTMIVMFASPLLFSWCVDCFTLSLKDEYLLSVSGYKLQKKTGQSSWFHCARVWRAPSWTYSDVICTIWSCWGIFQDLCFPVLVCPVQVNSSLFYKSSATFVTWLWEESSVLSKGVPSCSQQHICQRKHWQEHQGSRGTAFTFIVFWTNKIV